MDHITIVTHTLAGGGCARVISELANWFVKNGIRCNIITETVSTVFYKTNKSVTISYLCPKSKITNGDIFKSYKKLRWLVRKSRPNVVLAMPEKVNVWVTIALIGTGVPLVVSERNSPNLYPYSKVKRALRKMLYPFCVDGFIFQTGDASRYFPKSIQKKGIILPNPLDLKRIPIFEGRMNRKEVVSVGRLERQKNFHLLIDAFSIFQKYFKNYVLKIYGEGILKNELEYYARENLMPGTYTFSGEKTDVLELIYNAGMFILPSDYEGLPNVLIEAMAMGLPVVSTDCPVGGPRALIVDGYNGLLVPTGNKKALNEAMCKIAGDDEFANYLGCNARKIRDKLDINKVAKKWLCYLRSVAR